MSRCSGEPAVLMQWGTGSLDSVAGTGGLDAVGDRRSRCSDRTGGLDTVLGSGGLDAVRGTGDLDTALGIGVLDTMLLSRQQVSASSLASFVVRKAKVVGKCMRFISLQR